MWTLSDVHHLRIVQNVQEKFVSEIAGKTVRILITDRYRRWTCHVTILPGKIGYMAVN